MSKGIELTLGEDERILIIDDYSYHEGRPMRPSSVRFDPPEPPESAELYDIKCHWFDTGAALTDEEWQAYQDDIEEFLFERIKEEAESGRDEPRDD